MDIYVFFKTSKRNGLQILLWEFCKLICQSKLTGYSNFYFINLLDYNHSNDILHFKTKGFKLNCLGI